MRAFYLLKTGLKQPGTAAFLWGVKQHSMVTLLMGLKQA